MNWYNHIKTSSTQFINLPDRKRGGYIKLLAVYLRAGELPINEKGENMHSTNWFTDIAEEGISVYLAWYNPKTEKFVLQSGGEVFMTTQDSMTSRPFYLVNGEFIGNGSDGEDLLDPKTVKIIRKVSPDEIVFEQDPWLTISGKELPKEETPNWDKL